jgi:hypothetical protein
VAGHSSSGATEQALATVHAAVWIDQQPVSDGGPDERKVGPDRDSLERIETKPLGFLLRQLLEDDLLE